MRLLLPILFLLAACSPKRPYHHFAYKTMSYWESEYNGHKIRFKILSSAKKDAAPAFYANCVIQYDTGGADTLKFAFRPKFHHRTPLHKRTFIGKTVEPSLFCAFEGDETSLAYQLTLAIEIQQFDPLVLEIVVADAHPDALTLHPHSDKINRVFPLLINNKAQKYSLTMQEKRINTAQFITLWHNILHF